MATFGPKNMYFALDDSGLAKSNYLCSYSYLGRSIGNLATKNCANWSRIELKNRTVKRSKVKRSNDSMGPLNLTTADGYT